MFGQIAGAVIGGGMANKAAKADRRAMAEANRMRLMPYLDMQPYLTDFYQDGTNALQDALDAAVAALQREVDLADEADLRTRREEDDGFAVAVRAHEIVQRVELVGQRHDRVRLPERARRGVRVALRHARADPTCPHICSLGV